MQGQVLTSDSPMIELNTTPLIDVLLVLLVMFIITTPTATHAVKLDLPGKRPPVEMVDPIKNKIVVTGDERLLWNGASISRGELRARLGLVARYYPASELHLQPASDARYELVDEVLAMTKHARVEKIGFVGNERFAQF